MTLAFVGFVFGGVEVVARIRQYHRFGPKSLQPIALRDEFTAFRLNPAYGRVDRQHDAQGFRRGTAVSVEKPPDTIRIFLAGASSSYGYTTDMPEYTGNRWRLLYNNQTIDYYLEQKLNQAFPSNHWEVINAAVPSYQLSQELAQIQSVLLRYRPDCVIVDGNNDIYTFWMHANEKYDPYTYVQGSDEFRLLTSPGSLRSLSFFLAEWVHVNSAAFRSMQDHLLQIAQRSGDPKKPQLNNPIRFSDLTPAEQVRFVTAQNQLGFLTHTVRQIHRILSLDGVKMVFRLDPEIELTHKPLTGSEQQVLNEELRVAGRTYYLKQLFPEMAAKVAALAREDGFSFLDSTEAFDQTSEQTFSDNVHLTPEGNQIIAEQLFQTLKDIFADKVKVAR
jgi:hypothetical protein